MMRHTHVLKEFFSGWLQGQHFIHDRTKFQTSAASMFEMNFALLRRRDFKCGTINLLGALMELILHSLFKISLALNL